MYILNLYQICLIIKLIQFTLKRSIYLLQYGLYDLQQQKDNVSGGAPPRRGHPLLCALRHDILSAWSQLGVGVEQAADEVDQPLGVGGGGGVVGWSHRVLADSFPPQDVVALVEQVAASVAPEGQDAAKRPKIRPETVTLVVLPNLRGHVGWCPCYAGGVEIPLRVLREQGGESKVGELPGEPASPLAHTEDVVRL